MTKLPLFKNKRFYNNSQDSIKKHLSGVLRVTARILKSFLIKSPNRAKALDFQKHAAEWTEKSVVDHSSLLPRITWLGHSTFLIQVNNITIITDPLLFDIGRMMKRILPSPLTIQELPPIDAIIISHNHRDHVDTKSLKLLAQYHNPEVFVPKGNEPYFKKLGFKKINDMNWWESITLNSNENKISFHCLPANHWSGRGLFDINKTLWSSWMIQTAEKTIYFAGDTAFDNHFAHIAEIFPTIDIALMPIGPEEPRSLMAMSHLGIEEALRAFTILQARHFIPMHWGTFKFGLDTFDLPIRKLQHFWFFENRGNAHLHIIRCGQSLIIE